MLAIFLLCFGRKSFMPSISINNIKINPIRTNQGIMIFLIYWSAFLKKISKFGWFVVVKTEYNMYYILVLFSWKLGQNSKVSNTPDMTLD